MRIHFSIIVCFFFTITLNGQINWILEPTQDSKQFVTPMIKNFDFVIVKYDDSTSKVVDQKGKTLIERDSIIWPAWFGPDDRGIILKVKGEKVKFYNRDFKCIIDDADRIDQSYRFNTITTTKNGLLGLMDLEGNVLIEHKYKLLKRINIGKFRAIKDDGTKTVLTIEDKPISEYFKNPTYNGTTLYKTSFENNPALGMLNQNGDTIQLKDKYYAYTYYRYPDLIKDSLLIVKTINTKKLGLISLSGELVLDTIFNSIKNVDSSPNLFNVTKGTSRSVFDLRTKKTTKYGFEDAYVYTNDIRVKKGGFHGILDLEGNIEVPPIYNSIRKRESGYVFTRNDSVFVFSKKLNAFSKDTFDLYKNSGTYIYILGKNKKYCLYDGINLNYITDTTFSKIKKVGNYLECTYYTYDTTYYDPPREIKNRKGEVTRTYSKKTREVRNYKFFNLKGELIYGPIPRELKTLNKTYSKHYIPKTDSVAFVNTKTFQVQKFLSSEVDNVKFSKHNNGKEIIRADTSHYILDHYLDPSIDAIPYDALICKKRSPVFIYKKNDKFGLLTKETVLTKPIFDSIERRTDTFIVEVNGLYGLLAVKKED